MLKSFTCKNCNKKQTKLIKQVIKEEMQIFDLKKDLAQIISGKIIRRVMYCGRCKEEVDKEVYADFEKELERRALKIIKNIPNNIIDKQEPRLRTKKLKWK